MAGPALLQSSFDLGIRRDRSKDRIGSNAAWDLTDYVPNRKGAPLASRGGWEQKGSFSGGTPGYMRAGIFAPFNGGRYLLAVNSSGVVYRTTAGGSTWTIDGTTRNVGALKQQPIFYFDDVFFPSPDGSQTVSRGSETTITEYTYNTASYRPTYLTYWKNRLIGAVAENIVFGPPGDPNQAWDDLGLYQQSQPIRGLATIRSATLVFYDGHTEIMRGSIPAGYSVTDDDIRFDMLFTNIGCVDAFSITYWNDFVLWADRSGVYQTDGSAATDLTERCGIRDFWRTTMAALDSSFTAGDIRVSAGVYSDILHVSITNKTSHAHVATFCFDIDKQVAWRYTNTPFTSYFWNPFDPHELYATAEITSGKVAELSHTLDSDSGYDQDVAGSASNGTAVLPVVEFPYHRFSQGAYRIVDVYVGYELDAADTTYLDVDFTTDPTPLTPDAPAYSDYADGDQKLYPFDIHGSSDDGYHWRRVPVRLEGAGLGVKITQVGASAATRIYSLGATVIPREGWEQV